MKIKHKVLIGIWYDGNHIKRQQWKLQKRTWHGWKTISLTTITRTVNEWTKEYKNLYFEFDKKTLV